MTRHRLTSRLTAGLAALPLVALLAACTSHRTAPSPAPEPVNASAVSPEFQDANRVLLRSASAEVETERVDSTHARAVEIVRSLGGRIDKDLVTENSADVVLRVPDAQLEAVLDSLATLGRMVRRTITVQDATEMVIDLEARIASLTAARDRLMELQQRTATVSEIVEVERELARIQAELDSLRGRVASLRGLAAYSRLELAVREKVVLGPVAVVAKGIGWTVQKLFVWQ